MRRQAFKVVVCFGLSCCVWAQTPNGAAASAQEASSGRGYILGPGDQVSVYVEDIAEEFANKMFRIDRNGELSLPLIGHVQAAGKTLDQLELECEERLGHVLKDPEVSISLVNFGSQPISVLGAVNAPGIRQLEGSKSLFEVLSAAGGPRADAGYEVKITRSLKWGPIPLPQATVDAASQSSIASVNLDDIIDARKPAENIAILPGDAISVPKAELVYVIGSVVRAGGFALNEHSSISALQALSLAEGLQKTAAADKARIMRAVPGSANPVEIPVNLQKLLDGKIADLRLEPNDILFVPNSASKVAKQRAADVIASAAGALIWRF